MHEHREYFDVYQANDLVPKLEFHFSQLARVQREVNELAAQAEKCGVKLSFEDVLMPTGTTLRDGVQRKFAVLAREYTDVVDEIHSLGVVIEDPDLGTVNFYSWIDGEEVVLSWQYGEAAVHHWFKVTEDFMARRPLEFIPKSVAPRPAVH